MRRTRKQKTQTDTHTYEIHIGNTYIKYSVYNTHGTAERNYI